VDSDKVGTQILKEMNRQKLPGEVTFMPLNRLHVKEQNYPQSNVCMTPSFDLELLVLKQLCYPGKMSFLLPLIAPIFIYPSINKW
jgi:hypothetical protein